MLESYSIQSQRVCQEVKFGSNLTSCNAVHTGYPEVGKTTVYDDSQKIDLDNAPLKGGILLKTLILSIDPYMRGRMRPEEVESYAVMFPH